MAGNKKVKKEKISKDLADTRINVKIILAALWISQFLIWTFGDMLSLLQKLDEPAANTLLGFVAAPLALIQVSMIFVSLVGKARVIRWANFIVTPIFILFNIGFLFEAKFGWEFLLGIGYIVINVLIILYAWKWPKVEDNKVGGIQ